MTSSSGLHLATPVLSVVEPRGLPVRTVRYHRRVENKPLDTRVNRQAYDALGCLVAQWDPRMWALVEEGSMAPANQTSIHNLSGQVLAQNSVDAGWRLSLLGEAGQVLHRWDSRGTQVSIEYDRLLRPVTVLEQGQGELERCVERLTYAGPEASTKNLCGQLVRHDDPAGSVQLLEADLNGGILLQSRYFLRQEMLPDWPLEQSLRDELLESEENRSTTQHHYNALGDVLSQTDAKGHRQRFTYSVDGLLHSVWLQLAGQTEQLLVSMVGYNAFAQVETEIAGNGVVTTADYSPVNGRLMHLLVNRANGTCLQDISYSYDPVGNILSVRDEAQPIRFFNNQRTEPHNTYRYDTLYQLIEATGRETAAGQQGPALPALQPTPVDPNQLSQFTQTYCYDAGNNLTTLRHVGAQSYTREMQVGALSNRSVPKEIELATAFDDNGNLLLLQPGQGLSWDLRNQLQHVTLVERFEAANDDEVYHYDGSGQRVRKIRRSQARKMSHRAEVRYLPGLELRTNTASGEILQVISVSAGRSSIRVLHWDAGQPDNMSNDQLRYNISDHLGSSSIELDQQARLLSQEGYYPYGGSAWWAGRNAIEASYRTVRYSGKERDVTGLYCYGFRYYAPWLSRWINPDPAAAIDGLNRFRMVRNNPITLIDQDGLQPIYPVLGAFLSDVFHDPDYARSGSYLLAPGESADYAPIAIWDNRIHVGTASRHMGIRPSSEIGFPHFVGEITGREITNSSGHYRPPTGLGNLIPEGYTYKEEYTFTSDAPIRLTMFSSPEDYVNKVTEFRTFSNELDKAKGVLSFLKEHALYERASLSAHTYENVHITGLFRAGGEDIEPGFEEVFSSLKAETTRLQTASYWGGTSKDPKGPAAQLKMLNKKINAMETIRTNDSTVSRRPYSAIQALIEPSRSARQPTMGGSANQTSLRVAPRHRKSSLFSWFNSRMRR
ncbi:MULTISPECIES: RHS repeat-associated core domain-containing protein [unclassified Pseudomonas]|uniref:RHS repeat-associated core domain-containing protein n=1 Tax=unclassified Pseudomonas TaxID=196821 RepID=UPI000871B33A|nr:MULTISPECIES: RHS repeat-associated core domain-containing protein [unclassified Pseudomonas]SCW97393.1 insecticidal toxin complex protein TccC [Pseudomonas sp. NFACC56-3]SFK63137.1 insecticidal toxin complex protein TccC [Pseudomonas sp. NFACC52]